MRVKRALDVLSAISKLKRSMVTSLTKRKSTFMPFKRNKTFIPTGQGGFTNHALNRGSLTRRLTQFGFGACSSGTLVHLSDPTQPVTLNVFVYDENTYSEGKLKKADDLPITEGDGKMTWIDVDGVHQQDVIAQIGRRYNIHTLVQTDVTTTEQRTKLDVLDDALFLVCKMIFRDVSKSETTIIEQVSFYLKENVLITFQETPKDLFDTIKNRIRQGKGRIRKSKIDYLFYSLVDIIVDHYMDVLDTMGMKVESIDNQLMKTLKRDTLESIYDMKRDMLYLRAIIAPLKEIILKLQKQEETQIMQESTNIYLKDLFDHVVQVNDSIDTYREMLASFIDFYMMLNSNAMNEVVKTLTIISTIFIPLTFISGVYGMNFQYMPELTFKYGYFIVLGFMAVLAITMLSCFKKKKWF
ncbi:unnamed protein product [Didymodactylos carnosus]|uniref:Magnesium transport protein CorA n=1 Tax=Didymodactylos carnosus TaxID=1234261 RepID=A0A813XX81_9BILA|nr:unnamed protein product [Didymodactylos carnosus]CAF1090501.1 unnamed protein product [Didymodactylos carnosus]CAF3658932.1 unnamed protein product [Didymodactylos carnosus]CAF3852228.1 unnamed protein product [Didymodactylos carnosus]